jgi:proton-dependent oligopeptide transporter, POT family
MTAQFSEASLKQPKGAYALFFLQLLAMVGFSMIYSLIVLYATNKLGFHDHSAYAISAAFNALSFATSVPGGYIAEKYLGFRFSTTVSLVLCTVGLTLVIFPLLPLLYLGMGIFIFGTGMMIPCFYVLLGRLYEKKDLKRDHGFMLSYIGMNVGGFLASSMSGTIVHLTSYSIAFLIGAIASAATLPLFFAYAPIFKPRQRDKQIIDNSDVEHNKSARKIGWLLVFAGIALTTVFLIFAKISNALLLILGVASIIFIAKIAFGEKKVVRNKLLVFLLLTVLSVIFWTLYSLTPSALTLFAERNIDRHVFGWLIPTANLSGLNPFFIITVGPLLSMTWSQLKKRRIEVSTPVKFAMGIILMGLGFLVLSFGITFHSAAGFTALIWLVFSYFLQTTGELLLGPIGYAMVGDLAPANKIGLMMGIWQLACGVGGALSQYFASWASPGNRVTNPLLTNARYSHSFLTFGLITIGVGLFTVTIAPRLQKVFKQKLTPDASLEH